MHGLFAALLFSAAAAAPDLILHHGGVFLSPSRRAEAVAISGERITAVGTDKEILPLKGPKTKVIDLAGRAVTPGFHDAHVHFIKGALSLVRADLFGTTSVAQIQQRLRKFVDSGPAEDWIQGRGWDHTAFADPAYPTRQDIDAIVSTRPVVLTHADGNEILWANTLALKMAGITAQVQDPPNGQIIRDSKGEPTGVLTGAAAAMLEAAVPAPGRAIKKAALKKALALARRAGVTSIQGQLDVAPQEQLGLWRELDREGDVNLRYFIWGMLDEQELAAKLRKEFADLPAEKFQIGGLKAILDGVISARTAALLKPYSDAPQLNAEPRYTADELAGLMKKGHELGFQIVMHAIGDRSVRLALDSCQALAPWPKARLLPPCKIEHIELIDPSDLPRFKALGVVASMQPSHMTYDLEAQNYNPQRLGDRIGYSFAWRSFLDNGAILAFGTDWPVMPLEPRVGLFAATTRQHFDGKPAGGWVPKQKLSLGEAIRQYTLAPAQAIGRDKELGSLAVGQLADLVVFDKNIFSVEGLALLKIEVDMTIFNGKIVYDKEK